MADEIDRATEQYAKYLEARIENSRGQGSGARGQLRPTECMDCGDVIPEKRRKAVPGCQRCIECQKAFEEGR